ncbi:MAG: hypothetical protein IM582_11205, partial [Chitinophagaceae bacterium]|nr:hypothetical protein [Chitinophagaceae bacterium]
MRLSRVFVLLVVYVGSVLPLNAQYLPDSSALPRPDTIAPENRPVMVGDIVITGNKRTKIFIVTRELPFVKGSRFTESGMEEQL